MYYLSDNIYTKECELIACILTIQSVNYNRNTRIFIYSK